MHPVQIQASDSQLSFVMVHVPAMASRQVATTVTLPNQLQVGDETYPISYLIVPYTVTENGLKAADLLFYIDVFGDQQFELSPHIDGVQSLYHRHEPAKYNPLWMEDAYSDEIVRWGEKSTGLVDKECEEEEKDDEEGQALGTSKNQALGASKSRALGASKSRVLGASKSRALGKCLGPLTVDSCQALREGWRHFTNLIVAQYLVANWLDL